MNHRVLLYVVATLMNCVPAVSRANDTLSLAAAQAEARAHAPDAALLEARVKGAAGIADDAGRAQRRDPALSVGALSGAVGGESREYGWGVGITWTPDITGSWAPRQRAAQAQQQAFVQLREDGLHALDEAVATGVASLAFAQWSLLRAQRVEHLYLLGLEAAKKQLEVGQGNALDVDAASLDLAGAREATAVANGALDIARAELARLLGRSSYEELSVTEPTELDAPLTDISIKDVAARDPRVLSAQQAVVAADQQIATYKRLRWPSPTLGINYESRRRVMPVGSFTGPAANGLGGTWTDSEIGATLSIPIPVLDRQTQPLAQSSAQKQQALAELDVIRATVIVQLQTASRQLLAAQSVVVALSDTPKIVEQDFVLLEKALRVGALDSVSRAQHLRRLEEAGRRYDRAVLNMRIAYAKWKRRTALR